MRRVVARFNFSCTLTGNRPQSLTVHTATVTSKFKNTTNMNIRLTIVTFLVLASQAVIGQNDYPTSNETHILWQPNTNITKDDYKGQAKQRLAAMGADVLL